MPKHKESSSPNRKVKYQRQENITFNNKVRKLKRHINKHTSFVYDQGSITQGSNQCSDHCAEEALKRLTKAGTWRK
jgi:hypothetical protein